MNEWGSDYASMWRLHMLHKMPNLESFWIFGWPWISAEVTSKLPRPFIFLISSEYSELPSYSCDCCLWNNSVRQCDSHFDVISSKRTFSLIGFFFFFKEIKPRNKACHSSKHLKIWGGMVRSGHYSLCCDCIRIFEVLCSKTLLKV